MQSGAGLARIPTLERMRPASQQKGEFVDPATAPTLTVHKFQAKWRDHVRRERASSQEHFIDLCRLVGFRTPAEIDPEGAFYGRYHLP